MLKILLPAFVLLAFSAFTQYNFDNHWEFVGPDEKPISDRPRADAGIGPVEFIRIYQKDPSKLLAGSLNGGLFYSADYAENWVNSGSDRWPYSTCGWADFHPDDPNVWFAYSQNNEDNGKPGPMGDEGGIYRTRNQGVEWKLIGDKSNFGSKYTKIYGTRFYPDNSAILFVMTSDGLYFTRDCMASSVSWEKVPELKGWIYDLDFLDGKIYVSNFFQSKWNVGVFDGMQWDTFRFIAEVEENQATMRSITFEPAGNNLLLLIDNVSGGDELWEFDPMKKTAVMLGRNQMVNFGSGHTFAVSPFDPNNMFIGSGIVIKNWNRSGDRMNSQSMSNGYHVDVEFVVYDPIDTGRVYLATHGGVYRTDDFGKTWESKSKGLGVAEVMGLSVFAGNPDMIAIGCFHDGTSILTDWNRDGNAKWRIVNGGDALIPIFHPDNESVVYTSNQYTGGGIYFSADTAVTLKNIHQANGMQTAGWEIGATLHPTEPNILFFNYTLKDDEEKGNVDACRTRDASQNNNAERISNFKKTHKMKKYKVYSLFNSVHYPDELYAYVLHFTENNGKTETHHRLFKTEVSRDSAEKVIESWYELELPRDFWVADLEADPISNRIIYVSYTAPKENQEYLYGDKGMVYALKFSKSGILRKEIDISRNIPEDLVGRYNMVIPQNGEREMFIVNRSGVFYGSKKQLKGKKRWTQVGHGLPHCKPFGIHYDPKHKIIIVGLMGRGVWRYRL